MSQWKSNSNNIYSSIKEINANEINEYTVYITPNGNKYHRSSCNYLYDDYKAITITNTGANGTTINGAVKNTNGGNITVTNTGKLNISSNVETKLGNINLESKDGIALSGMLVTDNGNVNVKNTKTDGIIFDDDSKINANISIENIKKLMMKNIKYKFKN